MKRLAWIPLTVLLLLGISAGLHYLHYVRFGDARQLMLHGLGSLALLPVQMLAVGGVVALLLSRQERSSALRRSRTLMCTFFSEVGTRLVGELTQGMERGDAIRARLGPGTGWTPREFKEAVHFATSFRYRYDAAPKTLAPLKAFLVPQRELLVLFLANADLPERGRFGELLRSVFHLVEELDARASFDRLPESDAAHLAEDAQRAFELLIIEWLEHAKGLQADCPYVYSVLARTHPLQESPSAAVT